MARDWGVPPWEIVERDDSTTYIAEWIALRNIEAFHRKAQESRQHSKSTSTMNKLGSQS